MSKKLPEFSIKRHKSKYDSSSYHTDPLSYASVLKSIKSFKQSGTRSGGEFNLFDTKDLQYFKPIFYFWNQDENAVNDYGSGGLLAPTWELYDKLNLPKYMYNSAHSYLLLNAEEERADKLKTFVELLSNICTESPWYFQSVSGVDTALTREMTMSRKFSMSEERKKITFTMLPDAYDQRIGTLLDLYREIVWSWQTKREMLPSNMRKFDMGLYIFSAPVSNIIRLNTNVLDYMKSESFVDDSIGSADSVFHPNPNTSRYITSYKYIEFHNCEIDYNSSAKTYSELNNAEGTERTYSIDIYFDDCYETRYNEFMMQTIGDMILIDGLTTIVNEDQGGSTSAPNSEDYYKKQDIKKYSYVDSLGQRVEVQASEELYKRSDIYVREDEKEEKPKKKTFKEKLSGWAKNAAMGAIDAAGNATEQVLTTSIEAAKSFVLSKALGNLYGNRLNDVILLANDIRNGNILGAGARVHNEYLDYTNSKDQKTDWRGLGYPIGNIYN